MVLERRHWRTVEKWWGAVSNSRCPLREAIVQIKVRGVLSMSLVESGGEHQCVFVGKSARLSE